jgi:C-terminal processing protease CtpA/Prc
MNAFARISRQIVINSLALLFAGLLHGTICRLAAQDAAENPRPVENLAQFAKLYGYVRFFHPSDEAATLDWDRFAMLGAQRVRDAADEDALRTALRELFEPITKDLRVMAAADRDQRPDRADAAAGQPMTNWQHLGVRLSPQSPLYKSRRIASGETVGDQAPLFEPAELPPLFRKLIAPDIAIELPLALPLSAEGAASAGKTAEFEALRKRLDGPDVARMSFANWSLRVANVIIAWNVFQHFHPYLDSANIDWEKALRPALRRALNDRNGEELHATLSELVAQLQDGHGHVYGEPVRGGLPIRVEVVEDQVVVTGVANDAPLKKGDILAKIDDVDAMELLRQRERYVSGSPQLRRFRALNQFGQGPEGSTAHLDIVRDGERQQLEIKRERDKRGFFFNTIGEFDFPAISEVRPGIFYINTHKARAGDLQQRLPELASARGVIFDQRAGGMSSAPPPMGQMVQPSAHIIPHLIDKAVQASPMRIPKITQPDRIGWTWTESGWPVQPKAPRLKGKAVFINEPAVVSYGETCMAMIADYKLATLVGAPTAGCNGNVNFLPLPGGFRIMWTGMEVLKHDHSPFYITGFVPDFPVARTIRAVKEGRDEYLDKAIAVIETP